MLATRPGILCALWISVLSAAPLSGQVDLQPVTFPEMTRAELEPLARAIGDRRIVLLGENGHGVGELTTAKVRLVEWLHRELGFEVVVFESGFFECARAWAEAAGSSPRRLLYDCLRYPFQHAEVLPLFELIHARADTDRPLELAGMDPQAQGFDSGGRPAASHATLCLHHPGLARRIARYDSLLYLVPDSGGLGDDVYPWLLETGDEVRAAYDSAAALSGGRARWAFRLAGGLLDRLLVRARAMDAGASAWPPSYYGLRDEWMARAVAAIADSIAGPRKVVVWLHNDHARYGPFDAGGNDVRSVGGFLREWYGRDVFSMGFFMGGGVIADNGRREREVLPPPEGGIEDVLGGGGHDAGYLVLSGNESAALREWASGLRPYLRMGLDRRELVPIEEFDALFYVHRVGPPEYAIPGGG